MLMSKDTLFKRLAACEAASGTQLAQSLCDLAYALQSEYAREGPSEEIEGALARLGKLLVHSGPPVFAFALGKYPSTTSGRLLAQVSQRSAFGEDEEEAWQWLVAIDNLLWSKQKGRVDKESWVLIDEGLNVVAAIGSERIDSLMATVKIGQQSR